MNIGFILGCLIPRFMMDDAGGYFEGDEFVPLGSMEFYDPEIDFPITHVVRVRIFTWFGWAFSTCEGEIYTFDEWLELVD